MADQPSEWALKKAVDLIWPFYRDDRLPKIEYARSDEQCQRVAHALDAVRKGVLEEKADD